MPRLLPAYDDKIVYDGLAGIVVFVSSDYPMVCARFRNGKKGIPATINKEIPLGLLFWDYETNTWRKK